MSDGNGAASGAVGITTAAPDEPMAGEPAPVTTDGRTAEVPAAGKRESEKERRLAERGGRILDALATLITRWGYGKTTVDDIAREAGVAKGTVYLHWPTKEAMLQALIEREEQRSSASFFESVASDPRGGTISNLYRHWLALSAQSPLLRALLTQDRDALGEWTRTPRFRARSHRRTEALHDLIRGMRAAGLMRTDITVEIQAYLISALLYGILTIDEYMPADLVPPFEGIADAFAVIVRRGFEPEMTGGEEVAALARGRAMIAVLMGKLADAAASPDQAKGSGRVAGLTKDGEDQ